MVFLGGRKGPAVLLLLLGAPGRVCDVGSMTKAGHWETCVVMAGVHGGKE